MFNMGVKKDEKLIKIMIISSSKSPYCKCGPATIALGRNWSVNIIIIIISSSPTILALVIVTMIYLITREKRQSNHSD